MSKGWKIAIGVIVGVIVIAAIVVAVLGRFVFGWDGGRWREGVYTRFEGVARVREVPYAEVRLLDDDGDGVPDRGEFDVDAPALMGSRFARGFAPVHSRPAGAISGRFFLAGGLLRLLFIGLLIGLGVFIGRRWRRGRRSESAAPKE